MKKCDSAFWSRLRSTQAAPPLWSGFKRFARHWNCETWYSLGQLSSLYFKVGRESSQQKIWFFWAALNLVNPSNQILRADKIWLKFESAWQKVQEMLNAQKRSLNTALVTCQESVKHAKMRKPLSGESGRHDGQRGRSYCFSMISHWSTVEYFIHMIRFIWPEFSML